jgi:hypothetical protein
MGNVGLVQQNGGRSKFSNGYMNERYPRFTPRCHCCQDTSHILKDCPIFQKTLKGEDETKPQQHEKKCFACGDSNHYQKECPVYRKFRNLQVKGAFGRKDNGNTTQGN